MIRVQAEPFDAAALLADFSARAAGAGAIASFTGLVRGENDGAAVSGLELDHHPRLTERALAGIGADAVARFALTDVAIVHRHGALAPGEAIVFVAAAAAASPRRVRCGRLCDGPAEDRGAVLEARAAQRRRALAGGARERIGKRRARWG